MRIAKDDVPVRINAPGAVARQQTDLEMRPDSERWARNIFRWAPARTLRRY